MKNLSEFLDQITAVQAVHDEESFKENFDALYAIATPKDDPVEMGEAFETAIGWDPITFYDKKAINDQIDEVVEKCKDYPQSVRRLNSMRGAAIGIVMKDIGKTKESVIAKNVWDFVSEQLRDVGEITPRDISRIGDTFLDKHGIGNPFKDIATPANTVLGDSKPKKEKKRHPDELDEMIGDDMDDIEIPEDFIDVGDDEY